MIVHIHGKEEKNYTLSDSTEQSDEIEHGLTFELLLCFNKHGLSEFISLTVVPETRCQEMI